MRHARLTAKPRRTFTGHTIALSENRSVSVARARDGTDWLVEFFDGHEKTQVWMSNEAWHALKMLADSSLPEIASEWGKIEVHHKDGDPHNHVLSNLELRPKP